MKKIKISELSICSTLKGLFTIGTDSANNSVKVSLEFLQTSAEACDEATEAAESATTAANTATANANTATANATAAAEACETATEAANTATANANTATTAANTAASAANTAATVANEAAEEAQTATEETIQATEAAVAATEQITVLIPTDFSVSAPSRITWGNLVSQKIECTFSPEDAMENVVFLSDYKAVEIYPDGTIALLATGTSRVHCIPTMNTALAKTILIEVGNPRLRLHAASQLRFTQAGGLRLT